MTEKIQKLDVEIKDLSLSKYGRNPIYDGIVNVEAFLKSKLKILWILKEVNSEDDEGGWDMRDAIKDLKTEYGLKKGWDKTFTSIVYISEGILNKKKWAEIPDICDNPDTIDVLNNIAYINLKKVTGGSRAKVIELDEAYKIFKELLITQINLIDADIIIFGGTYLYFKNDFVNNNFKQFGSCNVFKIENKIYIDAYHPQYIGITRKKYFNDIIEAVNSLK